MKLCVSLLLFAVALTMVYPAIHADDIVFQKQLPGKEILIVSRRETQYVPPKQETLKQLSPGVVLSKPDHVYLYDFVLHTDKQADKILWSHQVNQFNGFEVLYGKFQVYDAIFEEGSLVVTWADEGVVYANIISPNAQSHYQPMPWQDTELQGDNATLGPIATGASIEGSLKRGTLTVVISNVASANVLKKMGGANVRYLWKAGKWVKDSAIIVPTVPDRREK